MDKLCLLSRNAQEPLQKLQHVDLKAFTGSKRSYEGLATSG